MFKFLRRQTKITTCLHKKNTWISLPIGDSENEIFGVRCNDCGIFIPCKLWGEDSLANEIEKRFCSALKGELNALRCEITTLTKDAKLSAIDNKLALFNVKFAAMEDEFSALANKENEKPTIEEVLEKQSDNLLNTLNIFAAKFLPLVVQPRKKPKRSPAIKPKSTKKPKPKSKKMRK